MDLVFETARLDAGPDQHPWVPSDWLGVMRWHWMRRSGRTRRSRVHRKMIEANQTAQARRGRGACSMIGGLDDFIEANATAINNAIPAGVRAKATLRARGPGDRLRVRKRGGVRSDVADRVQHVELPEQGRRGGDGSSVDGGGVAAVHVERRRPGLLRQALRIILGLESQVHPTHYVHGQGGWTAFSTSGAQATGADARKQCLAPCVLRG